MKDAYEHCEAQVRERDRERFLSALFAPADKRPHLFALYAFDLEIAHVPDAVREPMAGEIRFQWWREVLAGERDEEARANPVAAALLDTRERDALPTAALIETIDARQFDLLGQPMASRAALDEYLDATAGRPIQCAARILDAAWDAREAARLAGRIIGLTRVVRNFPRDVSKGRLFVPLDLLAAHDVHTGSVLAGETSEGLPEALRELSEAARGELEHLRARSIPGAVLPTFLPVTLSPLYLARADKAGYDPFRSDLSLSGFRSQFVLWRAARSGKV